MKKFKQFEVGFEANQNLILWITFVFKKIGRNIALREVFSELIFSFLNA